MKSRNKLIIRWVFYLLGLLILALGIMLNTKANLGVSPIISVPYSISHIIGFNFANMTMIVYFIFVLIEMIMHTVWYLTDRKQHCITDYSIAACCIIDRNRSSNVTEYENYT